MSNDAKYHANATILLYNHNKYLVLYINFNRSVISVDIFFWFPEITFVWDGWCVSVCVCVCVYVCVCGRVCVSMCECCVHPKAINN